MSIETDATLRLKLTDAAVDRGKRVFGVDTLDDLADKLGFARMTFWRLRVGEYDIRLSKAMSVSDQLGWPITRVFERVVDRG